ncbi:MAG: hypothetical protein ACF8PN_03605 [Phycisphaerales bacterium]
MRQSNSFLRTRTYGALAPLLAGMVSAAPVERPMTPAIAAQRIEIVSSPLGYGDPVYDNTENFWLRVYAPGAAFVEVADDVHLEREADLVSIQFAYYIIFDFGSFDATINVWTNDEDNSIYPGAGAELIASYSVPDLPKSPFALVEVRFDLPERLRVDEDLWLGVSFSDPDVYTALCDPPVVGWSDDLFSLNPPGGLFYFGGDPAARFWWGAYADAEDVLYLDPPVPGRAGAMNTFFATGAEPGDLVYFLYGMRAGESEVPECDEIFVNLDRPVIFGTAVADSEGEAIVQARVPASARGREVLLQVVDHEACRVSNVQSVSFE